MRRNNDRMRRVGVAAVAIVAAGVAALSGATAASAASGTSNQGVTDVVITPNGAINFLQDEASGTFTWKMDDGRPNSVSNWSVTAGDQATYVLSAPEGLTFPSVAAECDQAHLPGFTTSCDINENRRVITITYTANATGTVNLGFADREGLDFPVRAIDGLWVTGLPTVAYTPFPGLQSDTPSTTGYVQQDVADSNQGVSNARLTPLEPAVNFATAGTQGRLTFGMGNGNPDTGAPWSLMVGDESAYQVNLIDSLRFLGTNPVCPTDLYPFATTTCELSADQRQWIVRSVVHTAVVDSTEGYLDAGGPNWLIVSTADNADAATNAGSMIFTPWYTPGGNNARPGEGTTIEFNTAPSNDTPLLAGGIIAALTLAAGGAIYGIRRRKAAA